MQAIDNVIEFKQRHNIKKDCIEELNLQGGYRRVHTHQKDTKGVIHMSHRSSAVRVIKTTKRTKRPFDPKAEEQRRRAGITALHRIQKFKALAEDRVNRTLHLYRLIENLASHNYKYTQEQADAVIDALERGLAKVKIAFNNTPRREPPRQEFKLP